MSCKQDFSRRWAALTLSVLLIVGCLMALPVRARAFTFVDNVNQIRLDVPEGDATYYYTPTQSNLFEDLAEQVQNSGRDVRVLVRTYNDQDLLGYSLEVAVIPSVGSVPAGGGVPQGSNLRDAQILDDTGRSLAEATVRMAYEGRFNFSEIGNGKLGDINALVMRGTGVEGTGWAPYDCDVYLIATIENMLMVSLIYESNASNEYRDQGFALLESLAIGPAALEDPAQQTAEMQTTEPTATDPAASDSGSGVVYQSRGAISPLSGVVPDMWAGVMDFWNTHTALSYVMIAAVVALVAYAVGRKLLKRKRERAAEAERQKVERAKAAKRVENAQARAEVAQAEAKAKEREERARRAMEEAEEEERAWRARQEAEREREERQKERESSDAQASEASANSQKGTGRRRIQAPATGEESPKAGGPRPKGTRRRIPTPISIAVREDTRPMPPTEGSEQRARRWEAATNLRVEPAPEDEQLGPEADLEPAYDQAFNGLQPQEENYAATQRGRAMAEEDDFHEEDQEEMAAEDEREYRGRNYDYTDDVSRYTQQPGPEVNDVSRYTHSEPSELDSLKDLPYAANSDAGASRTTRRPSVGSRVEKNRTRRKRGR